MMTTRRTSARGTVLLAVSAATWLAPPPADAADSLPVGVVVALGGIGEAPLLREAAGVGGAQWRVESVAGRRPDDRSAPPGEIKQLRRAYLEADFLRCLSLLHRPALDVDRMLEQRQRRLAGEVAVLAAACAHGAGDLDLSRMQLRRTFTRALEVTKALNATGPDFQELAETIRAEVHRAARVRITIRSRPSGARLRVDGGALRCAATPCTLSMLPGDHLITAERLGYARRALRVEVARQRALVVSLDPADSATALTQLRAVVAGSADPGTRDVSRLATLAFGAQVVALTWRRDGKGHALVYDRRKTRIIARVAMRGGANVTVKALRAALREWRGSEPRPLYARPVFYLTAAGVVAAAIGVGLYFGLRPRETRHDLVFR